MMPCAWTHHAALIFGQRPEIDIGIHLTLTSEWDAVKWRPLTDAKTLVDETGTFLPLLTPGEDGTRPNLLESDWSIDEVSREFSAQIELGVAMFPHASHISSHMTRHFKDFDPRLEELVTDLCTRFGLKDDPFGHGLRRIEGYPKVPCRAEARIPAFVSELASLPSGTYIFIDHPAVDTPELAATGHLGYEDVAPDRVACLQTLTSSALKEQVEQSGIQLISYRDL